MHSQVCLSAYHTFTLTFSLRRSNSPALCIHIVDAGIADCHRSHLSHCALSLYVRVSRTFPFRAVLLTFTGALGHQALALVCDLASGWLQHFAHLFSTSTLYTDFDGTHASRFSLVPMVRQHVHARCKYTAPSGERCKTLVPVAGALTFPRGRSHPFFCARHQRDLLAPKTAVIPSRVGSRVFKYQGEYPQPVRHTGRLSRDSVHPCVLGGTHAVDPPVADASAHRQVRLCWLHLRFGTSRRVCLKSGLVCFVTAAPSDLARPDLIHIKVGRSNDVARRLCEHRRRCPSFNQRLLGYYPQTHVASTTSTVAYCDRLERLVHIELADLAAQSYPAGRCTPRPSCVDCQCQSVYFSMSQTVYT